MVHGTELPEFGSLKILVAGETVLDRYLWGAVDRISPEAPIPVLRLDRREQCLGNAGFVCAIISALGAQASLLSVIGADLEGEIVRELAQGMGIGTAGLIKDRRRPTIVKERLLGSVQSAQRGVQQLLRVDQENVAPLAPVVEDEFLARLDTELEDADGVLISDINKGLLNAASLRRIIGGARQRGKVVIVDPRLTDDFSIYHGVSAVTPNRFEAERAAGARLDGPQAWEAAGRRLIERHEFGACLITLDRDGLFFTDRAGLGAHVNTKPREVNDVTGAGDVVLALFGVMVSAGAEPLEAARLANVAAGLEVAKHGAGIITRGELNDALARKGPSRRKLLAAVELETELERRRLRGESICFAQGYFEQLGGEHIRLLDFARSQGDVLVVGLKADHDTAVLKNGKRRIRPVLERAEVVAALEAVDYVIVLDSSGAERLAGELRAGKFVTEDRKQRSNRQLIMPKVR